MPKKKSPEEIASKALWVRPDTKDRIFDLMEFGGETVDDVICKLLKCWEENHKETDAEHETEVKDSRRY